MNERRQVGPSGPQPITIEAMVAFLELSGRTEHVYRTQVFKFIPILDREFLRDFYEKQAKEMEKMRKQHDSSSRSRGAPQSRQIGRK